MGGPVPAGPGRVTAGTPFRRLERIGQGSFGAVYRAEEHGTGRQVAVKVINLEELGDESDEISSEINVLSQASCPKLIQYLGSYTVGSELWIVMEYLSGGSLGDLMAETKLVLDEATIASVMRDLLLAVSYLHGENKMHRDIKAKNVLVSEDGEVKLSDFGTAAQLTETRGTRDTFVGTPYWMAPEVIIRSRYNAKADVWSLGITAIELAEGKPPHYDTHPMKALFLIPKNPPPELDEKKYSEPFRDFVSQCLKRDPKERPTARELLSHTFICEAQAAPHAAGAALADLVRTRNELGRAAAVEAETKVEQAKPKNASSAAGIDQDETVDRHRRPNPSRRRRLSAQAKKPDPEFDQPWDFTLDERTEHRDSEGTMRGSAESEDSATLSPHTDGAQSQPCTPPNELACLKPSLLFPSGEAATSTQSAPSSTTTASPPPPPAPATSHGDAATSHPIIPQVDQASATPSAASRTFTGVVDPAIAAVQTAALEGSALEAALKQVKRALAELDLVDGGESLRALLAAASRIQQDSDAAK
uniref:non-specific serine/threonine protein kinase n=1 Tax=Rhizochromulina marina TaxID=1034831 RepID=A0A7S2SBJ8_9STRA|mmetsp:Transcript_27819/g.81411  ORF Transcript_27819/g.81411 Transcript_27819/m.81411 type:complete len:533 (+) Transcript_27819:137-1735(+)